MPRVTSKRALGGAVVLLLLAFALLAAGWPGPAPASPPAHTGPRLALPGAGSAAGAEAPAAQAAAKGPDGGPGIGYSERNDLSRPLSQLTAVPAAARAAEEREMPTLGGKPFPAVKDPVVQNWFSRDQSQVAMPSPLTNWEGVSNLDHVYPPDTVGDVGPNHYVQWVNTHFQVFNKAGVSLYGPTPGNALWSGLGGVCETTNQGDPIVVYDSIAGRWVMSQFAFNVSAGNPVAPFYECVAVSQTSDPLGAWYRYAFLMSNRYFNDYPKFGVWPDGYYASFNTFDSQSSSYGFSGAWAVVFDRTRMLSGQPASFQYFALSANDDALMPSDLDGPTLPPPGAPNVFAMMSNSANVLKLYNFHVDWANPAASSLVNTANLPTAPYNYLCPTTSHCLPQAGTAIKLDGLGDRLMFRLAYRNFGSYQTMVLNHTVAVTAQQAGVRWYEIRNPATAPAIYQQGTYAPDGNSRWMGSVAMDGDGNMALGYSVSGPGLYPSIRYTGRVASDPPGLMTQGETSIIAGSGAQTGTGSRWGDYSMMSVDPVDDCTFWYTQEYIQATGTAPWKTRIASFKFPFCQGAIPTATPQPSPTPQPTPTLAPGQRFTDVPPGALFYDQINWVAGAGIVSGYANGDGTFSFRPLNAATRGQVSKMIVLAQGWTTTTAGGPHFRDVPASQPFYTVIETAYAHGVMSGYTCGAPGEPCPGVYFRPNNNVTRGQFAKMLVNARGWPANLAGAPHFLDVPASNTFYSFIETAYNHNIISGYTCGGNGEPCPGGYFRPANNITRGQLAKMIDSAYRTTP